MTRIKGIPVILISKSDPIEDELGSLIYEDKEIVVENVLVAPTSSDDILSTTNLYGKKAVYTLAIPKGDKNKWEGQEVRFFGQRWRVFGKEMQGIDDLIPLDWNKKVYVENYE